MVSASAISETPSMPATRRAIASLRSIGTSPSNGQPNAVDIVTLTLRPAAAASGATCSTTSTVWSEVMFWLRWAKVSVLATTRLTSWMPGVTRARS